MIRRAWKSVTDLWEDDDAADRILYDPVHVAAVGVGCLFAAGVLFWDLWALMVYEGGIFTKIGPFLQVLFTSKKLQDFGYEGAPYALGIFEGWTVNLIALLIGAAGGTAAGWIFIGRESRARRVSPVGPGIPASPDNTSRPG